MMHWPSSDDKRRDFEAVVLPHLDALYSFALKMTRSRGDAADLVQDATLRAFRFFHRFEPGTNIRAWLFRILKNTSINAYRKAQRAPEQVEWGQVEEFYDSIAPEALRRRDPDPEEILANSTVDPRIEQAVAALPDEYRAVILLSFVEEMSYKEIAEALDIPMGTVMSRLHRGRKILQRQLADLARAAGIIQDDERESGSGKRGDVVDLKSWRRGAS